MTKGRLFVVATPLGNVDDLSPRARQTLARVQAIACEDTRHSGRMLQRLGIDNKLISYHTHNEASRAEQLVERLLAGDDIALISDAGTPAISDPGARLVKAASDANIDVSPIPGPSALGAILSICGLDTDRVLFIGFLPPKAKARRDALAALLSRVETIVVYESPHRVVATLNDIASVLGDRTVVVGRELTKLHEEVIRGPAAEVATRLDARERVRGELVLAIAGADPTVAPVEAGFADRLAQALAEEGMSTRSIRNVLASTCALTRKEAYQIAMNAAPS